MTGGRARSGPICIFIVAASACEAAAHEAIWGLTGFPAMAVHPLAVPEHLVGLIALALLAGQQGGARARTVPAATLGLEAGLLASFAALVWWPPPAAAAVLPLVCAAGIGGAVAAALALPPAALAGAGLALGYAIGIATLPDAPTRDVAAWMLAGVMLGAGPPVLAVGWLASVPRRGWQRIGLRVVGSWIAASALLVLALAAVRP